MQRRTSLTCHWFVGATLGSMACKSVTAPPANDRSEATAAAPADPTAAPVDVAAPPPNATRTPSGLASLVLRPGHGKQRPEAHERVKLHYTGWTRDGALFDTSHGRLQPPMFDLSRVIPGWAQGLRMMVVGEKRRLWIPPGLAYGDQPRQPGAPAGQLTFDIELLEVIPTPLLPSTPSDVATPPETALRTDNGLSSVVLRQPLTLDPPAPHDKVQFHYTGWTSAGRMFDTSLTRETPVSTNLLRVPMAGLKQALSLMSTGEKRRFWIPAELAYGTQAQGPTRPPGQLTYDIELLRVVHLSPPPQAPPDVEAPSPQAQRTPSGLSYRVLRQGRSGKRPQVTSTVEIRYTGWTTKGELFDSSSLEGSNTIVRLDRVIRGWTEGICLMTEGEQTRFWVPAPLAYGEHPHSGTPGGSLVFDIELIRIRRSREQAPPHEPPPPGPTPHVGAQDMNPLPTHP